MLSNTNSWKINPLPIGLSLSTKRYLHSFPSLQPHSIKYARKPPTTTSFPSQLMAIRLASNKEKLRELKTSLYCQTDSSNEAVHELVETSSPKDSYSSETDSAKDQRATESATRETHETTSPSPEEEKQEKQQVQQLEQLQEINQTNSTVNTLAINETLPAVNATALEEELNRTKIELHNEVLALSAELTSARNSLHQATNRFYESGPRKYLKIQTEITEYLVNPLLIPFLPLKFTAFSGGNDSQRKGIKRKIQKRICDEINPRDR